MKSKGKELYSAVARHMSSLGMKSTDIFGLAIQIGKISFFFFLFNFQFSFQRGKITRQSFVLGNTVSNEGYIHHDHMSFFKWVVVGEVGRLGGGGKRL